MILTLETDVLAFHLQFNLLLSRVPCIISISDVFFNVLENPWKSHHFGKLFFGFFTVMGVPQARWIIDYMENPNLSMDDD